MTTIACNQREMAADSKFTFDDAGIGSFLTNKLYYIGSAVYGEAGESASSRVVKWLQRGANVHDEPEFAKGERGEFLLLELSTDGIFIWDDVLFRFPVKEKTMAIGSGRRVALYCMRYLGMSPAEAVHAASLVDEFTKPPIYTMSLATGRVTEFHPKKRKHARPSVS